MRMLLWPGLAGILLAGCLREDYNPGDCRDGLSFDMRPVPYLLEGAEAEGTAPYYTFTEQLDLFAFSGTGLKGTAVYDYEYCRTHPEIPYEVVPGDYVFLFVANLYDHKALDWTFRDGRLTAVFSVVDNEEPPILLAALNEAGTIDGITVPVNLKLLVSRLEIRIENPPEWVDALDVDISRVAASLSTDGILGDTTHIRRRITLTAPKNGIFRTGVNAFPTYPDVPAVLNIDLVGKDEISRLVVNDSRLHLLPGVITRVNIAFDQNAVITVSVEVNGKWEIVDEGNIII